MTKMNGSSTKEYPRKFQLDFKRWRCGGSGGAGCSLGRGETLLRNLTEEERLRDTAAEVRDGFHNMCCLGLMMTAAGGPEEFFVNQAVVDDVKKRCGAQPDVAVKIPEFMALLDMLTDTKVTPEAGTEDDPVKLDGRAMRINDSKETTVRQKMTQLTELFASVGVEIEFINVPADL
jgi:hypothetical protein